jgi:2'-5' RNA ligase
MRLFTCTYLSDDNQSFYDQHVARLVNASHGLLRPIPRLSAHLTYAFMPAVSETEYERIVAAMDAIEHPVPIPIGLGHPIVIYARKQPRLVCAEVLSGEPELKTLVQSVIEGLNGACPSARLSPVKSLHVTLARFRRDAVREYGHTVEDLLASSELTCERRETISEIHIVESNLTPAGPVYTVRHRT